MQTVMDHARHLGACDDYIEAGPTWAEHPDCYRAVIEAFDARYADVPDDRLRTVMATDHARGVIGS